MAITSATTGLVGFGVAMGPAIMWSVGFGLGLAGVVLGLNGMQKGAPRAGLAITGAVMGVIAVIASLIGASSVSSAFG